MESFLVVLEHLLRIASWRLLVRLLRPRGVEFLGGAELGACSSRSRRVSLVLQESDVAEV